MELKAFLCDAASVREGLLHVLGAGITRIWRDQFPAPMNADLGLLFTMHPLESEQTHRMRIVVQTADGERVAQLDAEFGAEAPPGLQTGERLIFPFAVPLRGVGVPHAGAYSIEILIDDQHVDSLAFVVEPRPQQSGVES